MERLPTSVKLAIAASAGAVAGVTALLVGQTISRRRSIKRFKAKASEEMLLSGIVQNVPTVASKKSVPEEIIREQLSRNYSFLGEEV